MRTFIVVIIRAIESAGSLQQHMRERNEMREESLLDITANSADTECEERPVDRYGSPIARRRAGDVGETSQVPSSRVVSCGELLVLVGGENVLVHYFELK